MSQNSSENPQTAFEGVMSAQLARKRFTAEEYQLMVDAGVFDEDSRIELIDGEIFDISPIGPRHASSVDKLTLLLIQALSGSIIVRVQNPIHLGEFSEPQPDLTLVKPRADFYARDLPSAADVLVAIEVSDTTADKDRLIKIPGYARAQLPEAWLVDLYNDRIEIYSQPLNGIYQEVRIVQRGQELVSKTLPQLKLNTDEILG
jgi:Uma2 family endonuclease